MLLTVSMASIPCLSRQPTTTLIDLKQPCVVLPTPAGTPSLQYFNIRVTDRLHRYRSIKRQWNEVASTGQFDFSKTDPNAAVAEMTPITHEQLINDYLTTTNLKEKDSLGNDPLHSQIEKDIIELRKLIKSRQKKRAEKSSSKGNNTHHRPSGENSSTDDQEKSHARKNTLNQVKIAGSQMRPSTFPENPSPVVNIRQSSNTWPHAPRHTNNQHIFNTYRARLHQQSVPLDSLIQGVPPPQMKITTPPKMPACSPVKPNTSYRLPLPPMIKKKEPTFIKHETNLPPISQPSTTESTTTCRYNYAASTSAASPHSMKLTRQSSLLPILVHSSPCVGVPSRRTHSGRSRENNELVDYKNLIHHLPPPVIAINDRGDHRILHEQLDHIRQKMPTCNVYENYTRS